MTGSRLTIGEVARRSGVDTSALRVYEEQGLIRSIRSEGNQRLFDRDVLRRVAGIRVARRVGLARGEIGEGLAAPPAEPTPNVPDWARLSRSWRRRLDEQI